MSHLTADKPSEPVMRPYWFPKLNSLKCIVNLPALGKKDGLLVFTNFIKLYACKSLNTNETLKYLEEYLPNYSQPRRIISDRESPFSSNTCQQFVEEWKVLHVHVTTGIPRTNGQVELESNSHISEDGK